MGITIVDRRKDFKGKSLENRQRFLKRIENQIKKSLPDVIKNTNVKDIISPGDNIKIPVRGIKEPKFIYDIKTGDKYHVLSGNKKYLQGDRIEKPLNENANGGSGRKGSNDSTIGEDDFYVSISKEEFLDYFFSDMELPDMVKKQLNTVIETKYKRSGYSRYGDVCRLNILKTYENSLIRRITLEIYINKKIESLENKLKNEDLNEEEKQNLREQIEKLLKFKSSINFMEDIDLRYNNYEKQITPVTSAVMFCIMDVSASMGEKEKDIAKRFFMLLYMFLTKQYEKIDIVFIRHHTEAKEVSEDEFFNSRETGGTVVFSALELMRKIISERYNSNWNIYAAQASDGDVWDSSDANECYKILDMDLLKNMQYMVYIEICRDSDSQLWDRYNILSNKWNNFEIGKVSEVSQIWKVFKDFFKKK